MSIGKVKLDLSNYPYSEYVGMVNKEMFGYQSEHYKELEKTLWEEAKKKDAELFLHEDIVVTLLELVPDFNNMETPKTTEDMHEFKIKMRPTGRSI